MKGSTWLKLGLLLLFLVGLGWGLKAVGIDVSEVNPGRIQEFVLGFGVWAPVIYLLAYGQPIVPLPGSIMTIAGGLAFGTAWGMLAALCGGTIRACSEFLVARLLGREAVAKLLKGKVAKCDEKIGEHGFKTVFVLRLIPNLPFGVQNYGLGLSCVRFRAYALATFLGMIPGTFAYVYFGHSLADPTHLWKVGVAIVVIVGLFVAQKVWKSRQGTAAATRGLQTVEMAQQKGG